MIVLAVKMAEKAKEFVATGSEIYNGNHNNQINILLRRQTKKMKFRIILNTIIFSLLSLLHFYWAFGGELWLDSALPTNSSGTKMLNPSMSAAFVVAFGLMFLAFITVGNQGFLDNYVKRTYFRYGSLAIAVVFILRAIGDFKFVGFFKTIIGTPFSMNDTQIFSPLCLLIALLSFSIFIFGKTNPE